MACGLRRRMSAVWLCTSGTLAALALALLVALASLLAPAPPASPLTPAEEPNVGMVALWAAMQRLLLRSAI